MIRCSVTVSLVAEARGGPFVYWDDLAAACAGAAQLGFHAVEVFPPGPDGVDRGLLRKLLGDHKLSLAAVGTGAGWVKHRLTLTSGDAAVRRKARDFIKSIIELAGEFGAPAIIGSMQGRHGDGVDLATAIGHLAEGVAELGEHARQFNTPLLYEPINRYETNLTSTIAAATQVVRRSGCDNVRLLADLFHMNIEEVNIAESLREGGPLIGHVHFVDSNRRPAGLGHLEYGPIVAALRDIGYDRYLSAEALPYPDPSAAARQTIAAYRQWFGD